MSNNTNVKLEEYEAADRATAEQDEKLVFPVCVISIIGIVITIAYRVFTA